MVSRESAFYVQGPKTWMLRFTQIIPLKTSLTPTGLHRNHKTTQKYLRSSSFCMWFVRILPRVPPLVLLSSWDDRQDFHLPSLLQRLSVLWVFFPIKSCLFFLSLFFFLQEQNDEGKLIFIAMQWTVKETLSCGLECRHCWLPSQTMANHTTDRLELTGWTVRLSTASAAASPERAPLLSSSECCVRDDCWQRTRENLFGAISSCWSLWWCYSAIL